jgi:hypothetical protein
MINLTELGLSYEYNPEVLFPRWVSKVMPCIIEYDDYLDEQIATAYMVVGGKKVNISVFEGKDGKINLNCSVVLKGTVNVHSLKSSSIDISSLSETEIVESVSKEIDKLVRAALI